MAAGGLVLLLALAGCRSGDEEAAAPDPVELSGPGTTLGSGFTVVSGTRLLWLDGTEGTIDGDRPLESWSARLELNGDPFEVYDAYVEQALDAGFTLVRGQQGCLRTYVDSPGGATVAPLRSPTASPLRGERLEAVECGFEARRDRHERLNLGVSWSESESESDGTTLRLPGAGIDYERWPTGTLHQQRPVDEVAQYASAVDDTTTPAEPVDPAALPQAGEPVGEHPVAARVTVLDGTQLVVPVEDCGQSGFSALLAVTAGDPEAAFIGYRDQMVTEGGAHAEESRTSLPVGEHRRRIRRWFQYYSTVEVVQGMPGGTPMLLVSYCEG